MAERMGKMLDGNIPHVMTFHALAYAIIHPEESLLYNGPPSEGYEGRTRYTGRSFEEAETDLRSDYERNRGASSLTWEHAKDATRDAWHRVERAIPGDFDKDGR